MEDKVDSTDSVLQQECQGDKDTEPSAYVVSCLEELHQAPSLEKLWRNIEIAPKEYRIQVQDGNFNFDCYLGTPEMNVLYQPLVHRGNDSTIWLLTRTDESNKVYITNKVTNRSNQLSGQPTYMNIGTSVEGLKNASNVIMLGRQHSFFLEQQDTSRMIAISTKLPDNTTAYLKPITDSQQQTIIVAVAGIDRKPFIFQLIEHTEEFIE